jgi:hypothetical protein
MGYAGPEQGKASGRLATFSLRETKGEAVTGQQVAQLHDRYMMMMMKLVRLMSLNEVGKRLSEMFPTQNGLKQDALLSLLFNFAVRVDHAVRRVQVNKDGFPLNGTHQLLVYADYINIFGRSTHTIKKNKV